jgi:hypothetical protein
MSKVVVVRYETKPEATEENVRLVEAVYAQLGEERPEGFRYATYRLVDGVSFVHTALIDGTDPLPQLAAFQEFQRQLGDRLVQPPVASGATLVGSYGI